MRLGRGLLLGSAMVVGCAYHSEYVTPDGSRMRPVWDGKQFVSVGADEMPTCPGGLDLTQTPDVILLRMSDPGPAAPPVRADPHEELRRQEQVATGVAIAADGVATWAIIAAEDPEGPGAAVGAVAAVTGVLVGTAVVAAAYSEPPEHTWGSDGQAEALDQINEFNDDLRMHECGPWTSRRRQP